MTRKLFVLLFVVSLFSVSGFASTWYVAPAGNDANSGSISSPFATITKASTVSRAGDTVYARGGVYNETVKIASKGTSAAPIVFSSYPGELAVIDGTGTAAAANLVQLNGTEWVDFRAFEVRNSTRIGICLWGAKNSRVMDNAIHDSQKGGIFAGYSSMGSSLALTITGNRLFHNVLENQYHTMTGGWSQALGIQRTDGVTVANNRSYENDGEGISIILSDNATVKSNVFYDNYSVEVYLDNAQFSTVASNFIYSTGNTRYYRGGYPAHGIGAANESYTDSNPLTDLKIVNNIVLRSRWGFFYGNYENGGGLKNTLVANNTFYDATHALLSIDSAAHYNSFVENNVFYQATGMSLATVAGSGVTYHYNNWYGGSAGAAAGSGDVVGNPQMANAGGSSASDYKLTSASPDIQAGIDVTTVSDDYFGSTRASRYDIGAHEYSVTTQPATDTTAPSAPVSLAATAASSSTINLSWGASTDNAGVTGYRIYRDGTFVTAVSALGWTDSGLASSTTYSYQVQATDAAGNRSALSNTASATTLSKKKHGIR